MARLAGTKSEDTKKTILEQATKIFEQKGYSGTSMMDIRQETQLSKGTIYYHFKDKEDLYLSCLHLSSLNLITKWTEYENTVSGAINKLFLWAELYEIEMKKPLSQTISDYIISTKKEFLNDSIIKLVEPEINVVKSILLEGKSSGEFRNDMDTDQVSFILYNFISTLDDIPMYRTDENFKTLYKEAVNIIVKGIKS